MLDSYGDGWNGYSIDVLVDDNTAGVCGDVENSTGLSVVELVWHTLMDGTVGNDINVVSDLELDEVSGQWSSSMLLVWL